MTDLYTRDFHHELKRVFAKLGGSNKIYQDLPGGKPNSGVKAVERWESGLVGLRLSNGANRVAALASLLTVNDFQLREDFLSAYVAFIKHNLNERQLKALEKSLRSTIEKNSTDARNWITIAITIRLLAETGRASEAYELGHEAWDAAGTGRKVPSRYVGVVRRAICQAKEQLTSRELADVVQALGKNIPLPKHPATLSHYKCWSEPSSLMSVLEIDSPGSYEPFAGVSADKKCPLHSIELDRLFRGGHADQVTLEVAEKRSGLDVVRDFYKIRDDWVPFAWLALHRALKGSADLFDSDKIRMTDGSSLACAFNTKRLAIQCTRYLATVVTTWSANQVFELKKSADGQLRLPANQDVDLACRMSNHFGVMGLVVTSDCQVVAMIQDDRCAQGGGDIVPFGGSIDYEDLELPECASLGGLLAHSLEREICEEAVLDRSSISSTILVGHTIDALNALKPDFYGISLLTLSWSEILEHEEDFYGGPLVAEPVDLSSPKAFRASVELVVKSWSARRPNPFLIVTLRLAQSAAVGICAAAASRADELARRQGSLVE